jgi:hypothetical protein
VTQIISDELYFGHPLIKSVLSSAKVHKVKGLHQMIIFIASKCMFCLSLITDLKLINNKRVLTQIEMISVGRFLNPFSARIRPCWVQNYVAKMSVPGHAGYLPAIFTNCITIYINSTELYCLHAFQHRLHALWRAIRVNLADLG